MRTGLQQQRCLNHAGREAIVAYYPKVLAGYAEHVDRPVRYIRDGSAVSAVPPPADSAVRRQVGGG